MAINRVTLTGNLTKDAELRHTSEGLPVLSFRIAINQKRKDKSGEWVDNPVFVDCSMFGKRSEKISQWMTKGKKVMVAGRLYYSEWMKDDEKRSKLSVVTDELEFSSELLQKAEEPSMDELIQDDGPSVVDIPY